MITDSLFGRVDFCACGYPDDHQRFVERHGEEFSTTAAPPEQTHGE